MVDEAEDDPAIDDDDEMTPEERAELEASIDRGLEQIARGDTVSAEELLRRVRAS
jgi:predicted transcriptional regulator